MQLVHKVRAVERIFDNLEREIATFKGHTHLTCLQSCGKCCEKNDIYASVLEFLPWAYNAFIEGRAEKLLEDLETDKDRPFCFIYNHLSTDNRTGSCTDYRYRGLICRLFGFSVMKKDGAYQLITCKRIKEETSTVFRKACNYLASGGKAPVAAQYYDQLRSIDLKLASEMLPINMALLQALKEVLSYYAYRKPPVRRFA